MHFSVFNRQLKYALAYHTLVIFLCKYLLKASGVHAFKLDYDSDLNPEMRRSFFDFIPLLDKYSVVCIHLNNEDLADEFIKRKTKSLVYLISDMTASVVSSLEACLSVTQSPEVLALSLSDSSLLQLSPVFPQPRHFLNTSLSEVLQRPVHKSQKLDLQGSTVGVAIWYYIPFVMFENQNTTDVELDELDGIQGRLLKELFHLLNGTVRVVVCEDYKIKPSNSMCLGGIYQSILDGKSELAFTNFWQVIANYDTLDFGPSLTKVKLNFMVRRPKQIDFQWQSFLLIFKPIVSITVLVTFVLVVIVYWTSVKLDFNTRNKSWPSCLLTIFGYFLATHSQSRRTEDSTRFTLTSWSMFSFLITTFLSSGIVTRLTVPLYEARVDSLQQLVEGQYYWTVEYYQDYLNDSASIESIFYLQDKWVRMFEKQYKYMEPEEVLMRIKTDTNIAFPVQRFGDDFVIIDNDELIGHKELKKFRLASEEVSSSHVTFGLRKNSPLFEQISVTTLKIIEAGLITHWKDEVIRKWPQSDTRHLLIERDAPTFSETQTLDLDKLQPILFVLVFGSILAFCVLIVEVFWYWYKPHVD